MNNLEWDRDIHRPFPMGAPPMMTPERIEELAKLDAKGTPGVWVVFDGCSWRRIGREQGGKEILYPCKDRNDGHPDMGGVNRDNDLSLLCAARNALPALLGSARDAIRLREENEKLKIELNWKDSFKDGVVAIRRTAREHLELRAEVERLREENEKLAAEVDLMRPLHYAVGATGADDLPEPIYHAWKDSPGYRASELSRMREQVEELATVRWRLERAEKQLAAQSAERDAALKRLEEATRILFDCRTAMESVIADEATAAAGLWRGPMLPTRCEEIDAFLAAHPQPTGNAAGGEVAK